MWAEVLTYLRRLARVKAGRDPEPSLLMVDCQVVKGGRSGTSFHEGHFKYRLNGAKRAIVIDYLGLPVAMRVSGARTHEVRAARELLDEVLPGAERVTTVMGDRGFRGLGTHLERDHGVEMVVKHHADRAKGEFTCDEAPVAGGGGLRGARSVAPAGPQLRGDTGVCDRMDASWSHRSAAGARVSELRCQTYRAQSLV